MCRPEIMSTSFPYLEVLNGRHPCVSSTYSGDDFIPNDVIINGGRSQEGSLVVVVTGPNMGGKSTLMRQTGLIVILAQLVLYIHHTSFILSPSPPSPPSLPPSHLSLSPSLLKGCYVPAAGCSLSSVDRVFTRIGASDRITSGQLPSLIAAQLSVC